MSLFGVTKQDELPGLFSVFDSKGEVYTPPMVHRTNGEAIRAFAEISNSAESMICKYPADYTLFRIGDYDARKGLVTPLSAHVNLGNGVQYKKDPSPVPGAIPLPGMSG